jgi:hypothetical protein
VLLALAGAWSAGDDPAWTLAGAGGGAVVGAITASILVKALARGRERPADGGEEAALQDQRYQHQQHE